MRKAIIILLSLVVVQASFARQEKQPPSFNLNVHPKSEIQTVKLKPVNVGEMIKLANAKASKTKVLQIGVSNNVKITPSSLGKWVDVPGGKLWKLRFNSKGATDISFGFTEYNLPPGAELYLSSYHGDGSYYDGPYTSKDNRKHNEFWTAALPGGDVAIEVFAPFEVIDDIKLTLTHVSTGFRDIFQRFGGSGLNVKAGSCNINVICPAADAWRDEIRSSAHYTYVSPSDNNTYVCSGTLIMDTNVSFKPYFLTAAHCELKPESVVTYWNYENVNCSDPVNGSTKGDVTQTLSGSTILANKATVDMMLLELSSDIPKAFNPYWAGWDRTGSVPNGVVGIHHPSGDEKSFSFNTDPLETVNSCIGTGGFNSHWEVDNWEGGTTEPGSSGSAIWDSQNHKVVGFLSGGGAACGNQLPDCYGKFSFAWSDGTTNKGSQLQPWLDPQNKGLTSVDGANSDIILRNGFESN